MGWCLVLKELKFVNNGNSSSERTGHKQTRKNILHSAAIQQLLQVKNNIYPLHQNNIEDCLLHRPETNFLKMYVIHDPSNERRRDGQKREKDMSTKASFDSTAFTIQEIFIHSIKNHQKRLL